MRNKSQDFIVTGIERRGNREVRIGQFYCILNNKTYTTLGGLRNAIKPSMTLKEFYEKYYKTAYEGICQYCGNPTRFNNVIDGYSKYCCNICSCKSESHKEAVRNRFIGNDEKLKDSVNKRNVTMANKSDKEKLTIIENRRNTCKERYGKTYFSDKTKKQWAMLSNEERRAIGQKGLATRIKNGTTDSGSYSNSHKSVEIDGKVFKCQGYEDQVLQFLADYGINISHINTGKDVPRIKYSGNKSGYHRPDIYISNLNLFIEVKSEWTFGGKPEWLEENLDKQLATIEAGYNHMIFSIYNKISENDKIEFSSALDMTISSQAHTDGKVQRLSGDSEYRPIVFGSGSAKAPYKYGV